ncbi:unnamed protein product [Calicophoron daubneyi]|uniref:Ethanolaminephosphotransferase n=1 Tax=Calicophoron daubneyi TaxID=300641 RepID=A0AAV2TSY1_CALDB
MLTEKMKSNLRAYKYSSVDNSPLSNALMHPFWDWVTQFYPKWLAPNLLTFGGFLLTVAHFFLLTYFNPKFDNPQAIPAWAWLLTSVLIFTAHTMDGTDGKQARRTKSSSPLGELFDHGCDSWVCLFLPSCMYSLAGSNITALRIFFIQWALLMAFFSSHWEKYITGVLFLPWTFDLGQLCASLVCFLAYAYGVRFFVEPCILGYSLVNSIEVVYYASFLVLHVPFMVHNILIGCPSHTPWHRGLGYLGALRPALPLVTLMVSSTIWALWSPADILTHRPRLFLYCFATVASNVSCHLILAQLCKSRAPAYNWLVILYSIAAVWFCAAPTARWRLDDESSLLWLLSMFATVVHIRYAVSTVKEVADALDAPIFRLKPQKSSL